MNDLETKVRAYYDLRPADYHVVQSVMLTQGPRADGVYEQQLSIVLRKDVAGDSPCLCLEFCGVRKLLLRQPEWSLVSVGLLEMLPQPASPWMERWLVVRDANQKQVISFECADFDVRMTDVSGVTAT